MTDNETLHQLINQLHVLGNVETGRGPKHPTSPNEHLSEVVAEFLDTYPFLKQDQSYVDFLESYAGLLLWQDTSFMSLSIYGFDEDVTLHLVKGEGPLIDEAGLLTFADLTIPLREEDQSGNNLLGIGFGFDTTKARPWGVYRCFYSQPYQLYCATFFELIKKFVAQKGRLLEGFQ